MVRKVEHYWKSRSYIYLLRDGEKILNATGNVISRIGDIAVRKGYITENQLRKALEIQQKAPFIRLGEILVEQGFINERQLEEIINEQIKEALQLIDNWEYCNYEEKIL
ncbi:hypothetical protein FHQ18_09315 [Deferribacter autotrophicus]|uniref:PatA-like N-terminal domain-containing protein n=1 Tax=Deferribacter autotrophicus TaxID=500465 RepID=A0A5A8F0Y8_9BACT|nr:hypothetical protein [Deferribacter autotrophicus]KAA0257531.1 hypothetical protein FHQ18_09315 [Deferribacter autotrophicus]